MADAGAVVLQPCRARINGCAGRSLTLRYAESAQPAAHPAARSEEPSIEGVTLSLVVIVALAIAFDYINGFHDTANAIATSVATRALRPQYALLMAAAFNFIGAFAGTGSVSGAKRTIASAAIDRRDLEARAVTGGI